MEEDAKPAAKTNDDKKEMTLFEKQAEEVSLLLPLGGDQDGNSKDEANISRIDLDEGVSTKASSAKMKKEMNCVEIDDCEDSENVDKSTDTASTTSGEEADEKPGAEESATKKESTDNDIEEGFEVTLESFLFPSTPRFACSKGCRLFWLALGGLTVVSIILVAVRKSKEKSKQEKRLLPPPWNPPALPSRKCDPQSVFCSVISAGISDCLCDATSSSLLMPISTHDPTSTFMPSQTALVPLLKQLNNNLSRPFPTNEWWSDLLISTAPSVWTHPYRVRLDPVTSSIMLSHPAQHRVENGMPNANGGLNFFFHAHTPDWKILLPTMGQENQKETSIQVTDWNDLGVTIRIPGNTSDSYIKMPLVRGMAFLTLQFSNYAPVLQSERKFVKINGATSGESVEFDEVDMPLQNLRPDRKWIMELENSEIWILYSDREISWQLDPSSGVVRSSSSSYTTTTLRFAKLPTGSINEYFYDKFQNCIVTGGTLHVPEGSATYAFEWTADGADCQTNGLLHFALPHHRDQLHKADETLLPIEGLVLSSTTYGMMQAYESWNLWSFNLDQDQEDSSAGLDFLPPEVPGGKLLDSVNWTAVLEEEITEEPWNEVLKDGSYYFNGKAIQKYATLCLLARQRETISDSAAPYNNLLELCISKLDLVFQDFIQNTWIYPLVYDEIYGGIVSSRGLLENNTLSDFGNSVYNDHHYHWGYWIVASAIFRELVGPNYGDMERLAHTVESLIRDVATPNHDDPWFPRFRQFDWYLGHSLSRGLVASADGKDQESTSEEMNFHYGMFLWGRVSGNSALEQLGKTLLKANARSIQSYYLFSRNNTVHPPAVTNNRVAGVIFENKLDYSTWFCGLPECIHGIHMLPVTPAYPMFRSRRFIRDEWEDVLSNIPVFQDDPNSSWLSLLYVNLAHVNATIAMETLPILPNLDAGLSRSWALYYSAVQAAAEVV